jgi:hypothetical protein
MTSDEAFETALELLELATLIQESGGADRQEEAEKAYLQAIAIRDSYFTESEAADTLDNTRHHVTLPELFIQKP